MPPVQGTTVPLDVILDDCATFQRVLNKSTSKRSPGAASVGSTITLDESRGLESTANPSAKELLEKANLRLELEQSKRLILELRQEVRHTEVRISRLTSQLKQATASKCDLVVACSDIESQKLEVEDRFESSYRYWKLKPLKERETTAKEEKDFMNDIGSVLQEMGEMRRRHTYTMLEKDLDIAQLREQLRREQWKRAGE